MSSVICHMSPVTCHLSQHFFYLKKIGQSGGASQWRFCYQRGLPRLVKYPNTIQGAQKKYWIPNTITVIHWYSHTVQKWYCDPLIQCYRYTVIQWYSATSIQWSNDTVLQVYSDSMVQPNSYTLQCYSFSPKTVWCWHSVRAKQVPVTDQWPKYFPCEASNRHVISSIQFSRVMRQYLGSLGSLKRGHQKKNSWAY